MKKLLVYGLGLLACILALPSIALAKQVLVYPPSIDDTHIASNSSSINGDEDLAFFGYGEDSHTTYWAYYKFNLDIPAGATIDSAYLRLYGISCPGEPDVTNFYISQVAGGWSEETLIWANRPGITGSPITANTACASGYVNYSIKAIVERWNGGAPNHGLALYGPKTSNWGRWYATKEAGANKAPMLIVYYTVPDAVSPDTPVSNIPNSGAVGTTQTGSSAGSVADAQDIAEAPEDFRSQVEEMIADRTGLNPEERFGIIMIYAVPILTFLFWVFVIVLIIVLIKKRKSKTATGVAVAAKTADESPKEKTKIGVDTVTPIKPPKK